MKDGETFLILLLGAGLLYFWRESSTLTHAARAALPLQIESLERRGYQIPNCMRVCVADYRRKYAGFEQGFGLMLNKMSQVERQLEARGIYLCGR